MITTKMRIHKLFYYETGIKPGLVVPPRTIFLKPGEICLREKCDFRKDCRGAEQHRECEFICHFWELLKLYNNRKKGGFENGSLCGYS
jgi:hypothetical protein